MTYWTLFTLRMLARAGLALIIWVVGQWGSSPYMSLYRNISSTPKCTLRLPSSHCIAVVLTFLADDEKRAREDKTGLWAGSHKPIAPCDWRKMSKDERDEYR